ncbi:MAG: hypothetical protein HDS24_04200 [Bacteroides sp.]|nr:hypothetical protein [Bacteroides sp.]
MGITVVGADAMNRVHTGRVTDVTICYFGGILNFPYGICRVKSLHRVDQLIVLPTFGAGFIDKFVGTKKFL